MFLDPWQQDILIGALAERKDRKWAARDVVEVVPRQNGKGEVLIVRQLAGLFLFEDDKLQVHTAHEFKTTYEHFLKIKSIIESTPDLDRKVRIIRTGTGDQSIELRNGKRLRFLARSKKSGRGLTGDVVYLDEAFALTEAMMGALLFTLRARKNAQLWYASSAPMFESQYLHSLLKSAGQPDEERLYLAAWENDPTVSFDDPEAWLRVNPAIGYRISLETVAAEWRRLRNTPEGVAEFARECLGIREGGDGEAGVIDYATWRELADGRSEIASSLCIGLSVAPDAAWASFSAAGRRADGLSHVETIKRESGTGWIVPYAVELYGRHKVPLRVNPSAGEGALIKSLREARVEVVEVQGREYAQACGAVLNAVTERQVRHIDQDTMNRSVAAAGKRETGEQWVWARPGAVDITPLTAATLAFSGVTNRVPGLFFAVT